MTKYIKLEELMKFPIRRNHYNKVHGNDFVSGIEMVLEYAKNIPAADVAPVRHGPCPYCDAKTNDFIPINQTVEYSGIEIALNRQGMLRVRVYESGQKTFTTQDIVEIKCCPNCGAKMDGGAD